MSFKKSFGLAISNLWFDKLRSLLTMLGMIIGVGAVIILISLMNGMMNMMNESFESMGVDTITVSVQDRGGSRTVSEEEMYEFADENTDQIVAISPTVTVSSVTAKTSDNDVSTTATGIDEHYPSIKDLELEQGRFLKYIDVEKRQKTCVIGTYIETELYGRGNGLGQTIKLNGKSFKVVGVLTEQADSESGGSDDIIYIPYTTAITMSSTSFVSSYTFQAPSSDDVENTVTLIENFLTEKLGDSDYFTVSSVKEMMDSLNEMMSTMQLLLICIAGISLLVSGIGIMNIMLVSVTERTREIGIRKSLGAKKKDIKAQFVIEAGTVSGAGGLIGIAVGSIISIIVGNLVGLSAAPTASAIGVSFGISVAIGIVFGYLPAKNAANLNPIDALRHD